MVTSIVGGQEGQRIGDVYKEGHRIGDVVQEASRRFEKDRLRVASFCELRTLIYSLCILPALTNSFSSFVDNQQQISAATDRNFFHWATDIEVE